MMLIDDFARYSKVLHWLTVDFVRAVPDDKWDCAPEPAGRSGRVKTVPHVAFEADDLEQELRGKKVIIKPNSPGVTVAFIEDHGAPVEFLQFDRAWAEDA